MKKTPPFPILSETELVRLTQNADTILANVGIEMADEPSRDRLAELPDTRVVKTRVYLSGEVLRQVIADNAPTTFTQHARNPKRRIVIGGDAPIFVPTYGTPMLIDEDGERRLGTWADYQYLLKLVQQYPCFQNAGLMNCVIHDLPADMVPLKMTLAHLMLSDKPFMGTIASPATACAAHEMVKMVVGAAAFDRQCYLIHFINATPALQYQSNPLQCLKIAAEAGQACLVASYMMLGATAPVTPAGALAQGYAEIMVGLALTQLWRAGTPVIGGIYGMPFSMRSMLPIFGNSASQLMQMAGIQLVRRLGVPCRGDGLITSAKTYDSQAINESEAMLEAALIGGADFILHSAGWLENGRSLDIKKFKSEAKMLSQTYFASDTDTAAKPLSDSQLAELQGFIADKQGR